MQMCAINFCCLNYELCVYPISDSLASIFSLSFVYSVSFWMIINHRKRQWGYDKLTFLCTNRVVCQTSSTTPLPEWQMVFMKVTQLSRNANIQYFYAHEKCICANNFFDVIRNCNWRRCFPWINSVWSHSAF